MTIQGSAMERGILGILDATTTNSREHRCAMERGILGILDATTTNSREHRCYTFLRCGGKDGGMRRKAARCGNVLQ